MRRHFDDFDDFANSAKGWRLEARQLDRGPFHGELFQLRQGAVLLSRITVNRRLELAAEPPKGFRNFGLPVNVRQPFTWQGRVLHQSTLQVYQSYHEMHSIIPPDFTTFTLSIAEEALGQLDRLLQLPVPWERLENPEAVRANPGLLRDIHQILHQIDLQLLYAPSSQEESWLCEELEFEIPQQLLLLLSESTPETTQPSPRRKTHALKQAIAYIHDRDIADPLTVRELYQTTGVSRRTLEHAFLEHFGVTPKAYIQAHRLNGVRKLLKESDPVSTKIADVANRWGFWHMGHFANDYRKLFGELPSETLGHSR